MDSPSPLPIESISSLPQIDERRALIMSLQALLDPAILAVIAALHTGEHTLSDLAAALRVQPSLSRGPLGRLIFLEIVSVHRAGAQLRCSLNQERLYYLNGALQRLSRDLFADRQRGVEAAQAADFTTEEQRILRIYLHGERLVEIPSLRRQPHLLVVLRWLANQFAAEQRYHEREVNTLLRRHHDDVASLRRYLVDFGLMARANDYYWRLPPHKAAALAAPMLRASEHNPAPRLGRRTSFDTPE